MCISYIHYVLKPLESVINVRKLSLLMDHLRSALHATIAAEKRLSRLGRKSVIRLIFPQTQKVYRIPNGIQIPDFCKQLDSQTPRWKSKNSANHLTVHTA